MLSINVHIYIHLRINDLSALIAPGGCHRSSWEHKFNICVGMQDKKIVSFMLLIHPPENTLDLTNCPKIVTFLHTFFYIYFSNVAELGGVNATKFFGKHSWISAATFLRGTENLAHCSRLHKRCFKNIPIHDLRVWIVRSKQTKRCH